MVSTDLEDVTETRQFFVGLVGKLVVWIVLQFPLCEQSISPSKRCTVVVV